MKKLFFVLAVASIIFSCENPENEQKSKQSKKSREVQMSEIQEPDVQSSDSSTSKAPEMNNEKIAKQAYKRGIKLFENGDPQAALVQLKLSLENFPEHSKTSHFIARIYSDLGQKGLAISYYQDAVKFDKNDTAAMLGIGQAYYEMGDLVKAKEYYDLTTDAAPNYALAYYNRGSMLGIQKQYNSSLQDLNRAIEIDPTNANAFLNRGLAYFYLKDMDKACEDWNQSADMGLEKGIEAVKIYCKDK